MTSAQRSKEWRLAHPDAFKQSLRKYRAANLDACKERTASWKRAHPETVTTSRNVSNSHRWDRLFGWDKGTHARLIAASCICELCGEPFGNAEGGLGKHTDHDHKTKTFRGIIHRNCNTGIGMLQDSETRCLQAAAYLGRKGN